MHRFLFGLQLKQALVSSSDRVIRGIVGLVGLLVLGISSLIIDMVLGRFAGVLVLVLPAVVLVLLWVVFLVSVRRRASRRRTDTCDDANEGDGVNDVGAARRRRRDG